ncbi:MAG: zinc ABC transporter substrate-binding protein [Prolixibacteraceae bacterium]|jgi:zinc transport system substrate-binding protein
MKKFAYLLIVLLFGCHSPQKQTAKMVTVSILPQKYFVDQIARDLVEVNVLVPPGSSPHNYSILPSQMKNLAGSKVWIQIGLLAFEEAWKEKFAEINKNLVIVNSSEGIQLISGIEHDDGDSDHHPGGFDPHIWLAPTDVKVISLNTLNALKAAFPEFADKFDANFTTFIAGIDSLTNQINDKLAPLKNRNVLIFHPTLGYFAQEFHLNQIPLELDGKEPSPKHMKDIVDLARKENIHVIFIQKEFDTENALQLAREIGGEVMTIDPLEYDWEKQILEITNKIAGQQ